MKKYFWSIFLSIVVGLYLGKFMFNQYDNLNLLATSSDYESLYFLQIGVYADLDSMKSDMSQLGYYIYSYENDGIHVYVCMTKSKENALKVKEYFTQKGYDILLKENVINNSAFLTVLSQYDLLLSEANLDTIEDICSQILSSYEELVYNENNGYSQE